MSAQAFNITESGFDLRDDLKSMKMSRTNQLVGAKIFYCARILEGLARTATRRLEMGASTLCMNLSQLGHLNVIPPTTLSAAHSLRHIGNANRHAERLLDGFDAQLAEVLLERFVRWFIARFGNKQAIAPVIDEFFPEVARQEPAALMSRLDQTADDLSAPVDWLVQGRESLAVSPILLATAAEILLYRERHVEAHILLNLGQQKWPTDTRLVQLMVLYHQWYGDLQVAFDIVQSGRWRRIDPEAYGIEAAVYRRIARAEQSQEHAFLSLDTYRQGWRFSESQDTYLGINTAALQLEFGKWDSAHRTAAQVFDLLMTRSQRLASLDDPRPLKVWDALSKAHAQLIMGNLSVAREMFQTALASPNATAKHRQRAKDELSHTLAALSLSSDADQFLAGPHQQSFATELTDQTHDLESYWKLAVAGHRHWSHTPESAESLDAALETIQSRHPAGVTIIGSLAEGADRLIVRRALDLVENVYLHVVLPMPATNYLSDFVSPQSRLEFSELLSRADKISVARTTGNFDSVAVRRDGYQAAAKLAVAEADELLVLWDGEPAKGRGGTAYSVKLARRARKPVVHIQVSRD